MAEPLAAPGGQARIFAVHDGTGEFHAKPAPAGVEDKEMEVLLPEQMVLVKGPVTAGSGLMVTCFEVGGSPMQPASA